MRGELDHRSARSRTIAIAIHCDHPDAEACAAAGSLTRSLDRSIARSLDHEHGPEQSRAMQSSSLILPASVSWWMRLQLRQLDMHERPPPEESCSRLLHSSQLQQESRSPTALGQ
jgi:hypothetical protein